MTDPLADDPADDPEDDPVGLRRPAPLTRRTVRSGGVDLAVYDGGNPDGPTVVMVHGWPDTHHLWNGVAGHLAADFHVVTYDTRGHGCSGPVHAVDDLRLEALAADFLAVADAVSPDRPVHALGHDWGSVAVWEAVCEPGAERRVASFTSISGPNLDHLGRWLRDGLRSRSPRRWAAVLAQSVSSLYIWYFLTPLARWVLRRGSRARWERFLRRVEGIEPSPDHHADTVVEDMVGGLRIYRANVLRRLRAPRERRTAVPVLQLVPTRDIAVRGASYADTPRWADRVERRDLPYGHWVPLSHPAVVAAETARFVREVEAAG